MLRMVIGGGLRSDFFLLYTSVVFHLFFFLQLSLLSEGRNNFNFEKKN